MNAMKLLFYKNTNVVIPISNQCKLLLYVYHLATSMTINLDFPRINKFYQNHDQ